MEVIPSIDEISNDVRGAYAEFLNGLAGHDFIARLVQLEASAMAEGGRTQDFQMKALCMDRLNQLYNIRTLLSDLSKPQKTGKEIKDAGRLKDLRASHIKEAAPRAKKRG